jgi:hypothetical protein
LLAKSYFNPMIVKHLLTGYTVQESLQNTFSIQYPEIWQHRIFPAADR